MNTSANHIQDARRSCRHIYCTNNYTQWKPTEYAISLQLSSCLQSCKISYENAGPLWGCSNVITNAISPHRWPNDDKTRQLWTKFVQNTRSDFIRPSQHSSICSEHFTGADYDLSFLLKEEMGLTGQQRRVLPGKYPTLKTPKMRSRNRKPPMYLVAILWRKRDRALVVLCLFLRVLALGLH
ncbi:putative THAP domain-containing protein 10-like [Apostichopus japonicus]|uniref:Putative THAP domain-containing protein 10-like n=1 Tax=Stichopus japonicus TaxID=307972 RepID=A0A2G8K0Y5_STIJA|nr:putative THAP domain-containing protein 10-like [Apostichopus japonicus]